MRILKACLGYRRDARAGPKCRKPNQKSQSAMECLMTYGWAILIISVVLAALFRLGVFSGVMSPRAGSGQCQVVRPYGPMSTLYINLRGVCSGQLPQYVAQFNGASSYVNAGNSPSPNIPTAITVSAWANTASFTSNYQRIVSKQCSTDVTTGNSDFQLGIFSANQWRW